MKRTILVLALTLTFGVPALGAVIAWGVGWSIGYGLLVGCLVMPLFIGLVWIALGGHALRRELRLRHNRDERGREEQ